MGRSRGGTRGLSFNYGVTQHGKSAELYIDRGRGSEGENEQIFEALAAHREAVEEAHGEALPWERLDGRRACRIAHRLDIGGYRDESSWPEISERMVDAMIRLEQALRPWLNQLKDLSSFPLDAFRRTRLEAAAALPVRPARPAH